MIYLNILFLLMAVAGSFFYAGSTFIFLVFCLGFIFFLSYSIYKKSFFMIILSALLFFGFYLKVIYSIFFNNGILFEPTGNFSYMPQDWDRALLISLIGVLGFLFSGFFLYPFISCDKKYLISDYFNIKVLNLSKYYLCWLLLLLFSLYIIYINFDYSVYHRAGKEVEYLPRYLQNFIKWLLVVGLDILALSLLNLGLNFKFGQMMIFLSLTLIIDFMCNVSILSRGFPVSGAIIIYASLSLLATKVNLLANKKYLIMLLVVYLALSVFSVIGVNTIRSKIFMGSTTSKAFLESPKFSVAAGSQLNLTGSQLNLIFGRWIGIEGVASISSAESNGWPLFFEALNEKKTYMAPSLYDAKVVAKDTPYSDIAEKGYYAITIPGVIGFSFYPGLYSFTFLFTFLLGIIGLSLENILSRVLRIPLAVAFASYLIAYRYASFGYAPADSYLLLISLLVLLPIAFIGRKLNIIKFLYKA